MATIPKYIFATELSCVREGDEFIYNDRTYRATQDAEERGMSSVYISAIARTPNTPSGWEIADILEHVPNPT